MPFTEDELEIVANALDQHAYWTLSDMRYRRDGYVQQPGHDDPAIAEQIVSCERLAYMLLEDGATLAWNQRYLDEQLTMPSMRALIVDAVRTYMQNRDALSGEGGATPAKLTLATALLARLTEAS